MNTSAFWIIVLGFWIFTLQNKIGRLEEMVKGLLSDDTREKDKKETTSFQPSTQEIIKEEAPAPAQKSKEEKVLTPSMLNTSDEVNVVKHKPLVKNIEEDKVEDISEIQIASEKIAPVKSPVVARVVPPKKEQVHTEPSWLMQLLTNYFTGGNLLVRIGGVILFFGLAFLVKYVAEHTTISIEVRLAFVGLVGVVLIVLGWKLKAEEGAYGQILQGLGVAVLYLVIYGASKFYTLLSLESAFVWMFVVVIIGSFLALRQSSLPLALFSTTGGFLVPILTSTGEGSHVILFSYYLFLNLGIFFMAWKQAWRVLNLVGFVFTFVIATSWGVLRYSPELFATTEPFLILFFLMYLAISILFVGKNQKHLIDSTLLFGLPSVAFPLQVALTSHTEYGAGQSAVIMGSLYLILSKVLQNKIPNKLLLESFFGLGILFFTIAIPYFFDADVTAAFWAVESSAVVWLAIKQKRNFARYLGEFLLFLSVGLYLFEQLKNTMSFSVYLGYLIIVVATLFTAFLQHKHREKLEEGAVLSVIYLLLSFAVWMIGTIELSLWIDAYQFWHKVLLGFIVGTVIYALVEHFFKWKLIVQMLQSTLPVGIVLFLSAIFLESSYFHPFEELGGFVFLLLMVWNYVMLHYYAKSWKGVSWYHISSLWFSVFVLSVEVYRWAKWYELGNIWQWMAMAMVSLMVTLMLMKSARLQKYLLKYLNYYKGVGVGGLLLFLGFWLLGSLRFGAEGLAYYVPIVNPLALMQITVIYLAYIWIKEQGLKKQLGLVLYFTTVSVVLSMFARAFAHYTETIYSVRILWESYYFQLGAVILLGTMVWVSIQIWSRYGYMLFKRGSLSLLLLLAVWQMVALGYAPDFLNSYFPLFNLLDITQVGVLLLAIYWYISFKKYLEPSIKDVVLGAIGVGIFILFSVMFARGVHYYQEIPYHVETLWHSPYFQTGLSLLWSVTAIALMLLSKRYAHRMLWIVGFGLLGVVVLKLFFVELASSGTIERIVSFMVVGVLLLLIGYFVPMPPSENKDLKAEKDEEQ